jgi:hypothetical protein
MWAMIGAASATFTIVELIGATLRIAPLWVESQIRIRSTGPEDIFDCFEQAMPSGASRMRKCEGWHLSKGGTCHETRRPS